MDRLAELDSTGVPTPFDIAYIACVEDSMNLEKKVHQFLAEHRVREEREFFTISVSEARKALANVADSENVEIFFEKVLSTSQLDSGGHSTEQIAHHLPIDADELLMNALGSLDPEKIVQSWFNYYVKDRCEGRIDCPEFEPKYLPSYKSYREKISGVVLVSLDAKFEECLSKLFNQISEANYYCLFVWLKDFFCLEQTPRIFAKKALEASSDTRSTIASLWLLFKVGLHDEAYKGLGTYLPNCEKEVDFINRDALARLSSKSTWLHRLKLFDYFRALFVYTYYLIREFEGSRSPPPAFFVPFAASLLNARIDFETGPRLLSLASMTKDFCENPALVDSKRYEVELCKMFDVSIEEMFQD